MGGSRNTKSGVFNAWRGITTNTRLPSYAYPAFSTMYAAPFYKYCSLTPQVPPPKALSLDPPLPYSHSQSQVNMKCNLTLTFRLLILCRFIIHERLIILYSLILSSIGMYFIASYQVNISILIAQTVDNRVFCIVP